MTIYKGSRFALTRKKCDKCGRTFIFEPYWNYNYHTESINDDFYHYVYSHECVKCHEKTAKE